MLVPILILQQMKSPKIFSLEITDVRLNTETAYGAGLSSEELHHPTTGMSRSRSQLDFRIEHCARHQGPLGGIGKHLGMKGLWWVV